LNNVFVRCDDRDLVELSGALVGLIFDCDVLRTSKEMVAIFVYGDHFLYKTHGPEPFGFTDYGHLSLVSVFTVSRPLWGHARAGYNGKGPRSGQDKESINMIPWSAITVSLDHLLPIHTPE